MSAPHELLRAALQHYQKGDFAPAEALVRQALAQAPQDAPALSLLGDLLARRGELDAAIALQRQVVEKMPQAAAAHYNLGNSLKAHGILEEAGGCFQTAIDLQPGFSQAHNNLGNVLQLLGRTDAAIRALQMAVKLSPNDPLAHHNLGHALKAQGQIVEAEAAYRRALELAPGFAEAWNNLADLCYLTGRHAEARACAQRACALAPANSVIHSNRINMLMFDPATTTHSQLQELDAWRMRFEVPLAALRKRHTRSPAPVKALRIGWVSPDYRDHVIGRNILPLFQRFDRTQFAFICYSDVVREDALTAPFRALATQFIPTAGMSDDALAARIGGDQIDILVDLALHMGHRLPVFARKPAPVQVTFAGYPGSTGLESIDYRLTDPYLDPPGREADYCEASVRLASFWCYDPLEPVPEVGPLPALARGGITFGCLNNFCKVNAGMLELWGRVLADVPSSRLLLLADGGPHRQTVRDFMQNMGIAPERIDFAAKCPRAEYLRLYEQVDIQLDTLPYNGHTTSLDGLYMGVPLVSLAGQTVVGRAGTSLLTNLGMCDLLAHSADEYVRIARELAQDTSRLADLRMTLRGRMKKSVLMDALRFTRELEAAFRTIWRQWCGN